MIKGTTKSGFKYSIPEKRLDNYALFEAIGEIDNNPFVVPTVLNLLLGKEQTDQLKKHFVDKDGIVSITKMTNEIQEIFEGQKKVKNS